MAVSFASALYQHTIDRINQGLNDVDDYLDDMIVGERTREDMIKTCSHC